MFVISTSLTDKRKMKTKSITFLRYSIVIDWYGPNFFFLQIAFIQFEIFKFVT